MCRLTDVTRAARAPAAAVRRGARARSGRRLVVRRHHANAATFAGVQRDAARLTASTGATAAGARFYASSYLAI